MKAPKLKVHSRKHWPEQFHQELGKNLGDFNRSVIGKANSKPVSIEARDAKGTLIGGISGQISWRWFQVGRIWVDPSARKLGLGAALMKKAEAEAKRLGASHAALNTWDFQAPGFYKKLGYQVFGRLKGYPKDHTEYFLFKKL